MTYYCIYSSQIDISIFDENGLNIYPQEVNSYLIFGPFDINIYLLSISMTLKTTWGFFRPINDEIISQGILERRSKSTKYFITFFCKLNVYRLEYNSKYLYSVDIFGKKSIETQEVWSLLQVGCKIYSKR